MRTSIAVALSVLPACSAAQAANQIELHGRGLYTLTPTEAAELQGRYALADGRVLEVARRGRRVTAYLDGHEHVMLAVSASRLQSADGRLTLDFDAARNGNVRGVRLTLSTAPAAHRATHPAAPALAALAAPAR